jgi:two-component system, cell cycle response regulator DivK
MGNTVDREHQNLANNDFMSYTLGYPSSRQAMPKKILVVEDLTDIRKMMKIMVELYGYEVIEARDGAEAVEQAREHRPSLVLMDLAMPLMNGADAARAIKSEENLENIPIIAVTAYRNMDEEAIEAGCSRVIHKPVDFLKLKTLLAEYAV